MADQSALPGSAYLQLVGGVGLLQPEEQVWEAMRRGFSIQQQSRFLSSLTIHQRDGQLRRFAAWTNEYPWRWRAQDVEEWTAAAAGERHMARTTVRGTHITLRLFMEYLIDGRYGWAAECEKRFGTHPVQICHEWNTVDHVGNYEGRPTNRPLTRPELQALFDTADNRAERIRRQGRKGWAAAFRDATVLKVAYAWGLRRREVSRLELHDWGRNPKAPEFKDLGALSVRWAKALAGGPPRRRTVLTVFDWAVEIVEEYLTEIRPLYDFEGLAAMWPTERGGITADANIGKMFANLRDEAGLPRELGPHCLRHSYVTHLIEDGFEPLFVQQQVGHAWASTTAIYTGVGSDFKNKALREILDRRLGPPAEQEG
ncbi:MAG: integrase/recombinase XerC [Acidimicrobiaceae bacterium]|nr:integrase/recombinase XerC [Acidimicrobiaceae bacterium]